MNFIEMVLYFFIFWILIVLFYFYSLLIDQLYITRKLPILNGIGQPLHINKSLQVFECIQQRNDSDLLTNELKLPENAKFWAILDDESLDLNIPQPCEFINLDESNDNKLRSNLKDEEIVKNSNKSKIESKNHKESHFLTELNGTKMSVNILQNRHYHADKILVNIKKLTGSFSNG